MQARLKNVYPDLNIDWLLTGAGEMVEPEKVTATPGAPAADGVPFYDIDFALGFDEFTPSMTETPEAWITVPGMRSGTVACRTTGHSMEPEISQGDIILLRHIPDPSYLPMGDIYAIVTTNGMRTVKRLARSSEPGCFRLIPTNPDYTPEDIPMAQIARVFRVVGALKYF